MPNAKSHLNELLDDLILSILELKMVLTRTDVIDFFQKYTLLGIQEGENLDLDKIIDESVERLEKMSVVKRVEAGYEGIVLDDIDIIITPAGNDLIFFLYDLKNLIFFWLLKMKKSFKGKASVGSGIEPRFCGRLWLRLDAAMLDLNLKNNLQLISLALSEEVIDLYNRLDFMVFFDEFEKLDDEETHALGLIGHPKERGIFKKTLIPLL